MPERPLSGPNRGCGGTQGFAATPASPWAVGTSLSGSKTVCYVVLPDRESATSKRASEGLRFRRSRHGMEFCVGFPCWRCGLAGAEVHANPGARRAGEVTPLIFPASYALGLPLRDRGCLRSFRADSPQGVGWNHRRFHPTPCGDRLGNIRCCVMILRVSAPRFATQSLRGAAKRRFRCIHAPFSGRLMRFAPGDTL